MREIKFRGKDYRGIKDTDYANFWQRGDLQTCRDGTVAIGDHPESAGYGNLRGRVIPETVGQYTGLKDKHGVEIYEGDVVKRGNMTGRVTYLIQEAGFVVVTKNRDYRLGHRNTGECYAKANDHEVIGNIHDNPELLEEEK